MQINKQKKPDLTQDNLKSILDYFPDSGIFKWKVKRGSQRNVGDIAGYISNQGYIEIRIFGYKYYAHRIAFLYMNDSWPEGDIDHINQIKSDNSFVNLRVVSNQENHKNQKLPKTNKTGHMGVSFNKNAGKWQATITVNYKDIYLGVFSNIKDAIKARQEANIKYGFHVNHGQNTETELLKIIGG